jgi:hypothetical protein
MTAQNHESSPLAISFSFDIIDVLLAEPIFQNLGIAPTAIVGTDSLADMDGDVEG